MTVLKKFREVINLPDTVDDIVWIISVSALFSSFYVVNQTIAFAISLQGLISMGMVWLLIGLSWYYSSNKSFKELPMQTHLAMVLMVIQSLSLIFYIETTAT